MRCPKRLLGLCLLGVSLLPGAGTCLADEPNTEPARLAEERIQSALEALESGEDALVESRATPPPKPFHVAVGQLDEESRQAVLERYRRLQVHHIAMLEHRERVFHWQLTANQVSFWMVLVLVFSGLVFAGIQFRMSMLIARETGQLSEEKQELVLGPGGITIRSSVIGLIILALSLAFFYLYLVYVFPIYELGSEGGKAAVEEPKVPDESG